MSSYGNSLADWIVAGLWRRPSGSDCRSVRRVIFSRYQKYATAGHPTPVRLIFYLLGNTKQFFVLALALYVGQEDLTFPPKIQRVVDNVVVVLLLLQIGLWAARSLKFYLEMKEMERGPTEASPAPWRSSTSSRTS